MDLSESTKVVCSRIQKLEPKNVSKIIGCLLFQLPSEREMIRLAFSPDKVIQSLVNEVKCRLGLSSKPTVSPPSQFNLAAPVSNIPLHFTPFSLPANSYWEPQVSPDSQLPLHSSEFTPHGCPESEADDYCIPNQVQFMSLKEPLESVNVDFSNEYHCPEPSLSVRTSRKVCHYYNMGFCKHGNNCRYIHGHPMAESFSQLFTPNSNELTSEDRDVSPGSLEKLELELTELLKSRRGFPVSIASLPMIYYEKYGRTLQAEGYLTESQRHGKAGYSLTKLLARLKSSIRLIDRPHGQHSVVLAEDVPKYMDFANDRSDPGGAVPGSRQIYLTFPAESTFSEHDVSNYFNNFGPVQDVRIPCQPKRMFGFVTFANSETVRQILAKGNPHFVCGARVLVKPYREKSRLAERKYGDKFQHMLYNSQTDFDLHAIPRVCDNSRLLKKQFFEEQKALELERRRLLELNLSPKPFTHRPYFSCSTEERKNSQEEDEFPFAERFNHLLDVLNQESSSGEDKVRDIIKNCNDESNQGLKLPESPFASSTVSGNSTDA